MFRRHLKFLKLLILLFTCVSGISLYNKRGQLKDESDLETKEKEIFSTINSIIKEVDEKFEEDVKKEEEEVLEDLKAKEKEVTESSVSEKKEKEEETEEKEAEEAEKEEESEKKEEEEENAEKEEKEEEAENTEKESSSSAPETVFTEKEQTPSSASPMLVTELSFEKEKAPENTFAVWNAKGKICLLAKFEAELAITYQSKGGDEKEKIHVPKHGTAKGKCDTTSRSPLLQISWQKFVFTMIFNKTEDDNWIVTSVEFTYDTSDPFFDGATNAGKKTARSKTLDIFKTPMGKSFYCPAQEVVLMYSGTKHVVTARFKDVYLQPYGIEDGQFSPAQRCSKVAIDGPEETPYVQDETVPLAVGCTLALITLLILLGFSFHRAYNAAKVDYNTME